MPIEQFSITNRPAGEYASGDDIRFDIVFLDENADSFDARLTFRVGGDSSMLVSDASATLVKHFDRPIKVPGRNSFSQSITLKKSVADGKIATVDVIASYGGDTASDSFSCAIRVAGPGIAKNGIGLIKKAAFKTRKQ